MNLADPWVSREVAAFMNERHLGSPAKAALVRKRAKEAKNMEELKKHYPLIG